MNGGVDDADLIWNRACDTRQQPSRRGDAALHDIILFHSLSMNGGIAHALDVDFARSARVVDHYRLFGAEDLASLVEEARSLAASGVAADGTFDSLALNDEQAEELDALDARLPDDSDLEALFRTYLDAHPEAFAPP
jgi:hypothetical protein